MTLQKYPIARTEKSRTPAIWERGGGATNTGHAVVVTQPDGGKPRACFVVRRGPRACGDHALIPIKPGMFVIEASRWRDNTTITVMRIASIDGDEGNYWAEVERIEEVPHFLEAAVEAARAKAREYHCRTPYWVQASDR